MIVDIYVSPKREDKKHVYYILHDGNVIKKTNGNFLLRDCHMSFSSGERVYDNFKRQKDQSIKVIRGYIVPNNMYERCYDRLAYCGREKKDTYSIKMSKAGNMTYKKYTSHANVEYSRFLHFTPKGIKAFLEPQLEGFHHGNTHANLLKYLKKTFNCLFENEDPIYFGSTESNLAMTWKKFESIAKDVWFTKFNGYNDVGLPSDFALFFPSGIIMVVEQEESIYNNDDLEIVYSPFTIHNMPKGAEDFDIIHFSQTIPHMIESYDGSETCNLATLNEKERYW